MNTHDFWYDLPEALIAQTPLKERDHSRMLVCERHTAARAHAHFYDLPRVLKPGDALVLNETRVIPARLLGAKAGTGAACEILLLRRRSLNEWETLVRPGRKLIANTRVLFGDGLLTAIIGETTDAGGRVVRFEYEGAFEQVLDRLGEMPLPPYIHEKLDDPSRYQTVYAQRDGSAAAPTAGLHFTPAILDAIQAMGVDVVPILLHVGLGTFRPVKVRDISEHVMHQEYYEVSEAAARRINAAHARGGRVICVGTTSVRTLETAADDTGCVHAGNGMTGIFITPGVRFKAVDMLLTNFHLPESTLLMLVSAFMGTQNALDAYAEAVRERYRFYSLGDCMLIGDGVTHPFNQAAKE